MHPLVAQIQAFCKTTNVPPNQLLLQWSPGSGCVIVANTPTGMRLMPVVTQSLDMVAKALYMLALDPHAENQLPPLEQPQYNFTKGAGKASPGNQQGKAPKPEAPKIPKSWREADTVPDIIGLFPKQPNADELLDLFALNKKLHSPELTALLTKHSQSIGTKR